MRLGIFADTLIKALPLSHSHIIYIRFDLGFCVTSVITIYKLCIINISANIYACKSRYNSRKILGLHQTLVILVYSTIFISVNAFLLKH